jgi:hypothetical protein
MGDDEEHHEPIGQRHENNVAHISPPMPASWMSFMKLGEFLGQNRHAQIAGLDTLDGTELQTIGGNPPNYVSITGAVGLHRYLSLRMREELILARTAPFLRSTNTARISPRTWMAQ